ncbi:GntR family transcriptional regulator [Planosporangium flavigriseum]|uniref:GntR family transcriptional regulator n=1 Tax=Planosporangium flavigriseum TaxID=373681 RepID=A0A8J3LLW5_9ACTN|nr:GntR family transcriptional regulator [Planosporangium flavigriseum]GIG75132.1 GntR family transcriptional regulator [Planosporangium flavigriseum]
MDKLLESQPGWVDSLSETRSALARLSTAERVADVLRTHLIEGRILPGTRLSEDTIAGALAVSRNTLREAFRLLAHERLLVHELNRGVFVRQLTVDDVIDLYRVRRILECSAVRATAQYTPGAVARVRAAVHEGETAARDGGWQQVGTANMHFHLALAALSGSPRVNELMHQLLAELRLVFHVMARPQQFHEPYLGDNARICGLVEAREGERAAAALADYLDRAEQQLVHAFTAG